MLTVRAMRTAHAHSGDTYVAQWFSAPLASAGPSSGTVEDLAMTEEESLLVINRLHQVLRPFLLRRLKSDVEAQLPGKAEYVVKCELSNMQKARHLLGLGLPRLYVPRSRAGGPVHERHTPLPGPPPTFRYSADRTL